MTEPATAVIHRDPAVGTMERCLNCGAVLHGRFCADCGQRDLPPRPTVRELMGEAWQEFVNLDGKVATTLRLLVTRPGRLTVDALAGKRARYVGVVRLYLLCSLAFFAMSSLISGREDTRPAPSATAAGAPSAGDRSAVEATRTTPDPCLSTATGLQRWSDDQDCKLERDPDHTRKAMAEMLPRMMFVLLPVFAAILAMAFRRHAYIEHLYFALHVHAFAFLAFVLADATDLTTTAMDDTYLDPVIFLAVAAYTIVALRTVYRRSWLATVVRAGVVAGVYVVAFMLTLLVAFAIVATTM